MGVFGEELAHEGAGAALEGESIPERFAEECDSLRREAIVSEPERGQVLQVRRIGQCLGSRVIESIVL